MKKFFIKYCVDVTEDNYQNGELNQINYYDGNGFIEANNSKDAIISFFDKNLCFDINIKYLDSLQDENLERYCYNVLCNTNNEQIEKEDEEFKEWEKGNINLYSNCINFNIYSLDEIKDISID